MKTFPATQLNKSPQQVFAAAKEDGAVTIEHDRYSSVKFVISTIVRGSFNCEDHLATPTAD